MKKRIIKVKFNSERDAHEERTYYGIVSEAQKRGVSRRDAMTTLDIAGFWKQYSRGAGRRPGQQAKNELLERVYEEVLARGVSSRKVISEVIKKMNDLRKPKSRSTITRYIKKLRTLAPEAQEKNVAR
jgi:hypothetical protein